MTARTDRIAALEAENATLNDLHERLAEEVRVAHLENATLKAEVAEMLVLLQVAGASSRCNCSSGDCWNCLYLKLLARIDGKAEGE